MRGSKLEKSEHPCDRCIVITDKLDPNEHCDGCMNEMRLIDYVPPDMRERSDQDVRGHIPVDR